jgi:hypothetical protein
MASTRASALPRIITISSRELDRERNATAVTNQMTVASEFGPVGAAKNERNTGEASTVRQSRSTALWAKGCGGQQRLDQFPQSIR